MQISVLPSPVQQTHTGKVESKLSDHKDLDIKLQRVPDVFSSDTFGNRKVYNEDGRRKKEEV